MNEITKVLRQKNVKILVAGIIILTLVWSLFAMTEPVLRSQDTVQYSGAISGNVTIKVEYIDEEGNVVSSDTTTLPPLAFYAGTVRIKAIRLTIAWETYDIQTGMNASTFEINGNITIPITMISGTDTWNKTVDIQNVAPHILSNALNASKIWDLSLRQTPLQLGDETKLHLQNRTDFNLNFTLVWQAKMYDTIDEIWETVNGTLSVTASCYYVRGFKIKVTGK